MFANSVGETVSAGGTGNLTLSGAIDTSYSTLFKDTTNQGGFILNQPISYAIIDGNDWESGIGYLSASATFVRQFVLETQVSGTRDSTNPSAINVTTSATVINTINATSSLHSFPLGTGKKIASHHITDTGWTTRTFVVDRIYWTPLLLPVSTPLRGIAVDVTTAAGVGTDVMEAGIYSMLPSTGFAGHLIDQSAAMDPSTTGLKEGSFLNGDQIIPPGWYWAAIRCDVAATVRAHNWGVNLYGPNIGAQFGGYGATFYITEGNTSLPAIAPTTTLGAVINQSCPLAFYVGA